MKVKKKENIIILIIFIALFLWGFLFSTNIHAKTATSKMYPKARTTATLKFMRCGSPTLIYKIKRLDDRIDHYIIKAGTGYNKKTKKLKDIRLTDGCIGAKDIKNGRVYGTADAAGAQYNYFQIYGRDKKTHKYYQTSKTYKVKLSSGKVVATYK